MEKTVFRRYNIINRSSGAIICTALGRSEAEALQKASRSILGSNLCFILKRPVLIAKDNGFAVYEAAETVAQ